ncbi:MAG: hypothetical protein JWQ10_576 [Herbaspirillum sp.]|jgi:hypothetical protein|nr:hypothetical protein [Herbaspirillum sp.]
MAFSRLLSRSSPICHIKPGNSVYQQFSYSRMRGSACSDVEAPPNGSKIPVLFLQKSMYEHMEIAFKGFGQHCRTEIPVSDAA